MNLADVGEIARLQDALGGHQSDIARSEIAILRKILDARAGGRDDGEQMRKRAGTLADVSGDAAKPAIAGYAQPTVKVYHAASLLGPSAASIGESLS